MSFAKSSVTKLQKQSFACILQSLCKEYLETQQQQRAEEERKKRAIEAELDKPPPPIDWGPGEVDRLLAILDEQEDILAHSGFHRMSSWWRKQIERFLRSGKRRWILRVGRRGGKSTSICRLLIAWVRSRMWTSSPGEVRIIPIVSKDMTEAGDRITNLKAILEKLGYKHGKNMSASKYRIHMDEENFEFRVYANGVIVGPTAIAFFGDEVAHWENKSTAANPAKKIMALVRPTMATQPLAFEILTSAPWGTTDYHFELCDQGDTDDQVYSFAPTWVANDNYIPEARTKQIEPDHKEWLIAYAAIPGATVSSAFSWEDAQRCFRRNYTGKKNERGFVATDASELREDAFAVACGYTTDRGELLVEQITGWEAASITPDVDYDAICDGLKAYADRFATGEVYGDQCEQASLTGLLGRRNKQYVVFPWSSESKHQAVTLLRRLMRTGKLLIFEDHVQLRKEIKECKAEKTPSGNTRYETNGLDYLSALITAAHAINERYIMLEDHGGISDEDMEMLKAGHELRQVSGL